MSRHVVHRTLAVVLEPNEIADAFCSLDSDGQVAFLNRVAEATSGWPGGGLPFQLQHITDSPDLTVGARQVMRQFGEYAEPAKAQP